jgi:hypothetical protein
MSSLTKEEHQQAASSGRRTEDTPPAPVDAARIHNVQDFSSLAGKKIQVGAAVTDLPFHPSPTLDERHISAIEDYEEFAGYLAPALNALSVATEGLKSIDEAWQALRKDTSKTPEQKALVIAPAAEKKQDAMLRSFSTANENLQKAVAQINAELDAPVFAAATASATNAELRTVLRGMKADARNAIIGKAVADGDAQIVTCVLGVHHLITGVDPLRHQIWTRTWREKSNPNLVRRLKATQRAIEILNRAAPIALGQVETAMRVKFTEVAKLKGLADQSAAALAKLAG